MIQMPRSAYRPALELVSMRSLECLMPVQAEAAEAALTEAQGWVVDQHVDYEGHVMIVATHGENRQTFVLSGTTTHVELARLRVDTLEACGTFGRIEAALDAVKQAASRESSDVSASE